MGIMILLKISIYYYINSEINCTRFQWKDCRKYYEEKYNKVIIFTN